MAGTTLLAAKLALVDILATRPRLAEVAVSYDPPSSAVDRAVWLGDAEADSRIRGLRADRKTRMETYRLEVICQATVPGGTQAQADEAAIELLQGVDEALADDPYLAGTVLSATLVGWEHFTGSTGAGHGARFEVDVACRARLR